MNTIALVILFLLRIILPVGLLIAVGEWIRRREANYWLHK